MILNTIVPKVTLIFYCKMFKDIHIPNFVLNGETLPWVSKYKYLGHIITEDLCHSDDISRQYKIIYAQGNALIRAFKKNNRPKANIMTIIITALIYYRLLYTCEYKIISWG